MSRTPFLIHGRRLPNLLAGAFRHGPDGSLEGKFKNEHPEFKHFTNGLYLAGCFAFLEGQYGAKSWQSPSPKHAAFDAFTASIPRNKHRKLNLADVTVAKLNALYFIRNAMTHGAGVLRPSHVAPVAAAGIPGVILHVDTVDLGGPDAILFLQFVRLAYVAVCAYHGDG